MTEPDVETAGFDVIGALRRFRRLADASQREFAARLGVSKSFVAALERGDRRIDIDVFARAAALAGLRLALLDGAGAEVSPMAAGAVRDLGGRLFPAHLDTRRSDEGGWIHEPRRDRPETAFTYGRDRGGRDARRRRAGVPDDHHGDVPGDSPADRRTERYRRVVRARLAENDRRFLAGEFAALPDAFRCSCPAGCDDLDDRNGRPVHVENCPCSCDIA